MRVLSGKVVDGHIEVHDDGLEDGTTVTVLVPERDADFTLNPEQVGKLEASLDQATRGEVVDGWQLLRDLRA
jgi:hypothetical protein